MAGELTMAVYLGVYVFGCFALVYALLQAARCDDLEHDLAAADEHIIELQQSLQAAEANLRKFEDGGASDEVDPAAQVRTAAIETG